MRVNFFVIATPGLLADAPTSYITSFHLPASQASFNNRLSQRFPNMTVVDMSAIMRQLQGVMDQVIRAVQFVFLFALGAGLLVLYAALLATQDERAQEAAVMRALGATRSQVLAAQRAEFAALGLIAGTLAAAGSTAIGYAIAEFVFQFPYRINTWIWIAGPCWASRAWGSTPSPARARRCGGPRWSRCAKSEARAAAAGVAAVAIAVTVTMTIIESVPPQPYDRNHRSAP